VSAEPPETRADPHQAARWSRPPGGEGRRRGTAPAPRWRCSARNR